MLRTRLRPESLVLALSLVLSIAALAVALRATPGQPAVASEPLASDLGPADGLLLLDKSGTAEAKDPLRLHAADGRISWGDRATNRVWSVAAVDIDKVMKKLLLGSQFDEKRRGFEERAKATEAEFTKRAEEIQAQFPPNPDGSAPPEANRAFAALQQEFGKWLEAFNLEQEKASVEQFEQAYRDLVAAVETVAEKESIDLVYRFYPTENPFGVVRAGEALAQIQARTFLKYPASIDITADVMKVLNLSE